MIRHIDVCMGVKIEYTHICVKQYKCNAFISFKGEKSGKVMKGLETLIHEGQHGNFHRIKNPGEKKKVKVLNI
jgi:hypothetical protein